MKHGLYVAILAGWLAGCAHTAGERDTGERELVAAPSTHIVEPVVVLLTYAHRLSQATSAERARAVTAARAATQARPGAWSYARLALAYGTPGQKHYTPDEAARYARRALAAENALWRPAAQQYLRDYARLYAQIARQGNDAKHNALARNKDHDKDARIARLERELDEAYRKLRALADVEAHLSTSADAR